MIARDLSPVALRRLALFRRLSWAGAGLFTVLLAAEITLFPPASASEAAPHHAASCGCISHSEDRL